MTAPAPLDRLATLIADAEERLSRSQELAQTIGETLLHARDASWRSRRLLDERYDEEPNASDHAAPGDLARHFGRAP
jgi:hypothetical protein